MISEHRLNDYRAMTHAHSQHALKDRSSECPVADVSDKVSLESTLNEVKCAHDKAVNENRILKRAVTIQQERQNHAAQEIQGARQFKAEAEDKLRKLEQMNLTLQYHLQAQNSTGNDFMNFPRPPDVY